MMQVSKPFSPGGTDWERRAIAAEKTVEVLKKKVQSMYREGAQTALHRQLARAKKREEENQRRRELTEVRAEELRRYSKHLENEVAQRTKDIQTILDNVTFGFLVCDQELQIKQGFTQSCHALFGKRLNAGDNLAVLFGLEGSKQYTEFLLGVEQVFDDWMPEEVSLDQLPTRFKVNQRIILVEGRVLRDDQEQVESLLMTLSDITDLEKAQQDNLHNQVLVGILKQKSAFEQFIFDAHFQLDAALRHHSEQSFVRRVVHTIKGNAASYGLEEVVECAHNIEFEERLGKTEIQLLENSIRNFLLINHSILDLNYDDVSQRFFEVSDAQIQQFRSLLRQDLEHSSQVQALLQWAEQLVQRPARCRTVRG